MHDHLGERHQRAVLKRGEVPQAVAGPGRRVEAAAKSAVTAIARPSQRKKMTVGVGKLDAGRRDE